jgi:hypothetical protein
MAYSRAYAENYNAIDWSDLKPTMPNRIERQIRDRPAFHFIQDIKPYKSPITGEVIGGRRQHREHLRDHGMIEAGNEKQEFVKRTPEPLGDPRRDIVQAMKEKGLMS